MRQILLFILLVSILFGCEKNVNNSLVLNTPTENEVIETAVEATTEKTTITYPSIDGLMITADLYQLEGNTDFMILFHQAEQSRGEYVETALRFNELGYNVLAVDQRSGAMVNDVVNQTAKRARDEGYPTTWTDAVMDVQASIEYVVNELEQDQIYLLGSSYSTSLIIAVTPEYINHIKGLLVFSPNEHVKYQDKKVKEYLAEIDVPIFMTSKEKEIATTEMMFEHTINEKSVQFKPDGRGRHGSIALWSYVEESEDYWNAVIAFLDDTK